MSLRLPEFGRTPQPPQRPPARTAFVGELGMNGLHFQGGGVQAAEALLEQVANLSNTPVSRADALKATAVLRARNLIAGVAATLPLERRDRTTREVVPGDWVGVQPNDQVEDTVTFAHTYEDLFFHGASYWRVLTRTSDRMPLTAEHLNFRSVSPMPGLEFSPPSRNVSEDFQWAPDSPILVDGLVARPGEIIRFLSPNPPLLKHAGKAIRTLLVLDAISSEYASNPLPFGYFKDADDADDSMDDEEVKELLNRWEDARRKRKWGYIGSGLELNMLQWPDPQKLQLAEARNHAVLEIARASGLQPEDLATVVEGTSRTYQNAEQRRLDLIDFTLAPYLSSVQDRLSMNDITPRDMHVRYNVAAYAKADFGARMTAYETGIRAGVIMPNEPRGWEGWPDLPDPPPATEAPPPSSLNGNGSQNGNGRRPVGANDG